MSIRTRSIFYFAILFPESPLGLPLRSSHRPDSAPRKNQQDSTATAFVAKSLKYDTDGSSKIPEFQISVFSVPYSKRLFFSKAGAISFRYTWCIPVTGAGVYNCRNMFWLRVIWNFEFFIFIVYFWRIGSRRMLNCTWKHRPAKWHSTCKTVLQPDLSSWHGMGIHQPFGYSIDFRWSAAVQQYDWKIRGIKLAKYSVSATCYYTRATLNLLTPHSRTKTIDSLINLRFNYFKVNAEEVESFLRPFHKDWKKTVLERNLNVVLTAWSTFFRVKTAILPHKPDI